MSSAESIRDGDYKIQQISRLLESGGTMLAQHCNVCGAPFFRYHGEILCPVCSTVGGQQGSESGDVSESISRSSAEPHVSSTPQSGTIVLPTPQAESEVVPQSQVSDLDEPEIPSVKDDVSITPSEPQECVVNVNTPAITSSVEALNSRSLEAVLLQNIEEVASKMVGGSDTQKIKERLDLIERTVALVERIKKL